jgi:hypothetical protein
MISKIEATGQAPFAGTMNPQRIAVSIRSGIE